MIDTIKISHSYLKMPSAEELMRRGWRRLFDKHTGSLTSWVHKENQFPYLSLFVAPDAKVYLSATVSLPAFIFGSNVMLLDQTEVKDALDKLSEYVTEKSGFEFNARTGIVWEVHFTKDYLIGEAMMQQVISKLAEMNVPRFERTSYSNTTLYFHSKGTGKQAQKPRTICIYDKHAECRNKPLPEHEIQQAKGVMRLEFRYKTSDSVKRLEKAFELPNREAQTIFTNEVSASVLEPIEKQISLILEETNSQNQIIKLTKRHGKRRAAALIQFLVYKFLFGDQFYKLQFLGFSRSAYYECQKDCREVGINSLFDKAKNNIPIADTS